MDDFKDNNCRVCKIVFCCKSCREKHESKKHKIFPECDVCLYGKIILKNPSQSLLKHLKTAHWPLHCVLCKRLFATTNELLNQCKCPVVHKTAGDVDKSPYAPFESYNYESPPLSALYSQELASKNPNLFSSLATSTPMQRGEETKFLEKMQVITPVDYSDINKESLIKKKRLDSNRSGSPKRKVTFSDTPLAENNRKQKTTLKNQDCQNSDMTFSTPNLGSSGSTFYSIREALQEEAEVHENNDHPVSQSENDNSGIKISHGDAKGTTEDENNKIDKDVPIKHEDSSMWVSATNISTLDVTNEENQPEVTPPKVDLNTLATPMATKLKKRQINIVMPTPVVKVEDVSVAVVLPIEVFSTPLPYVPDLERTDEVKLEPNSSICKVDGNTPSTSERELDHQENNDIENITGLDSSVVHSRLWSSMSRLLRSVTSSIGRDFATVDESLIPNSNISFKRSFSDIDSLDGPCAKRYKLTEIKCRRTIRELPTVELTKDNSSIRYSQSIKFYVDKATQTD